MGRIGNFRVPHKEWLSNCNMCGKAMVTNFCSGCKRYHKNICPRCVVHDNELAKLKRDMNKGENKSV